MFSFFASNLFQSSLFRLDVVGFVGSTWTFGPISLCFFRTSVGVQLDVSHIDCVLESFYVTFSSSVRTPKIKASVFLAKSFMMVSMLEIRPEAAYHAMSNQSRLCLDHFSDDQKPATKIH